MKSLDDIIEEAAGDGIRITNLYEATHGAWICYTRKRDDGSLHDTGWGWTAREAVLEAVTGVKTFKESDKPAGVQKSKPATEKDAPASPAAKTKKRRDEDDIL